MLPQTYIDHIDYMNVVKVTKTKQSANILAALALPRFHRFILYDTQKM